MICPEGLAHFRGWLAAPINAWRAKGAASSADTNERHVKNAALLLEWYNENLRDGGERELTSLAELWKLGPEAVFSVFTRNVDQQLRGAQRLKWGSIAKRLVRASTHPLCPPPHGPLARRPT